MFNGIALVAFLIYSVLIAQNYDKLSRTLFPRYADYNAGDTFKQISRAQGPAIVLGVQKTCIHCKNEIPFYKKLAEMPGVKEGRVHLVAAVKPEDGAEEWVNSTTGLPVLKMDKWHFNDGTPTMLLLDANHKISSVYLGEIANNPKSREAVERFLR